MADPKPTKTTPTSPIKDTNGDGILQGREILEQLVAEEMPGRVPSEKVHGVLNAAGVTHYGTQYAEQFLAAQLSGDPSAMQEVNTRWAKALEILLRRGSEEAAKPAGKEQLAANLRELNAQPNLTDAERRTNEADVSNFIAFADAAKVTFPKGVKIEPHEVTAIIGHLVNLPFVVPKPLEEQKPSPRDNSRT